MKTLRGIFSKLSSIPLFLFCKIIYADGSLGDVANNMTAVAGSLATFIQAICFIAGFGFGVGAIIKYKNHRDNPQQVTLGVPVTLFFISLAFLFLGIILLVTGQTLFGGVPQEGTSTGVATFY